MHGESTAQIVTLDHYENMALYYLKGPFKMFYSTVNCSYKVAITYNNPPIYASKNVITTMSVLIINDAAQAFYCKSRIEHCLCITNIEQKGS